MSRALILFAFLCHFAHASEVSWNPWSNDLFQKAKAGKKLVVLDLEAVWCHWCHVMEEKTYSNAKVQELLAKHFIAVKVDQDARPDLSRRYEDYGWPATIFFDSNGKELAKRSGFMPPEEFIAILEKLIQNPVAEANEDNRKITVSESPFLSADQRADIVAGHVERYDTKLAGWGKLHKFLFGDSEELALRRAWRGDAEDGKRARTTLTAALQILDPVWGGAYQYSVRNWKRPHFEKIAETQYKNLHLYSTGYLLFKDEKFLNAARGVEKYLRTFLLSPEGAFYTSQDADLVKGVHSEGYFKLSDTARRKKGIPIIDTHLYTRENGWYISGLASLYAATGEAATLELATRAAEWIFSNRGAKGGGFRHDATDVGGPYLGDSLEAGLAFLKLYEVTAERKWLDRSRGALDFIRKYFSFEIQGKAVGFKSSESAVAATLPPEPIKDENVRLARFANLVHRYTGEKRYREIAEQAMRYLASPEIAKEWPTAGVLVADMELGDDPVHLTVVGKKSDPEARKLFLSALRYPTTFKRVEWWDSAEGPLPNSDVTYPNIGKAALFACIKGRCSLPIAKADEVGSRIDRLYH